MPILEGGIRWVLPPGAPSPRSCSHSCFPASPGLAAEGDPVLRWADVLARLDGHPLLAVAGAEVAAADGALRAARRLPNPELELGGGRSEEDASGENSSIWDLSVSIPLRPWGPYRHAVAAAGFERAAVEQERSLRRLEVERELSQLFWRIAHDQRRADILAAARDRLSRLAALARLRAELGEARPTDPLRFEIELAKLEAEIRAATDEADLNRLALRTWVDPGLPEDFRVDADWDLMPRLASLESLRSRVSRSHPALLAAESRLEGAGAGLRLERAERLPGLTVGGFVEQEADALNRGLQVSLEVPLFDWNGGRIAAASAAREAASHRRTLVARELERSLAAAMASALRALDTVGRYRDHIVPKSLEAVAALERMYTVGEVGILDLLDARRELVATEEEMLSAQLEFRHALADLNALVGGEDHD